MCEHGASWTEWRLAVRQLLDMTDHMAGAATGWEARIRSAGAPEVAEALRRAADALSAASVAWRTALVAIDRGQGIEEDDVAVHVFLPGHTHSHEHG